MHILQHRVPDAVVPAFLFTCIVAVGIWAWLWQRLGPMRSSLFALLVVWAGLVLALTVSPKKKFRGQVDKPRSCDLQVVPAHVLGVFTNHQRLLSLALYLPIGALIILAARHRERVLAFAVAALMPIGVEAMQYALPRLRRTCQTIDVYDSWTGIVVGAGLGVLLLIAAWRSPFGRVRAARHRKLDERPSAVGVVKVFWPPDEAVVRGEPPVVPEDAFVPSGAIVPKPVPPSRTPAPRGGTQPSGARPSGARPSGSRPSGARPGNER